MQERVRATRTVSAFELGENWDSIDGIIVGPDKIVMR